jgi:hypothetical protein
MKPIQQRKDNGLKPLPQPHPAWKPKTRTSRLAKKTIAVLVGAALGGLTPIAARAGADKLSQRAFLSAYRQWVTNFDRVVDQNNARFNATKPHSAGAKERAKTVQKTVRDALWQMMLSAWLKETGRKDPVVSEREYREALERYLKAETFVRFGNTDQKNVSLLGQAARIQWLKKALLETGLQFDRDSQKSIPYNHARLLLTQKQSELVPIGIASGLLASLWLVNRQRKRKGRQTELALDSLDVHQRAIDDTIQNVNNSQTKKQLAEAIEALSRLVQTSDSTPIVQARKEFAFFFVRGKKIVFTNNPKKAK